LDLQKILRIAVVLHGLLIIVCIPVSRILDAYLPIQLLNYKLWVHEQGLINVELSIIPPLVIIACVCHLISSIGLFFFKPWAKWAYSACIALVLILLPFMGPRVEHALTQPIEGVQTMATGVILYMIFFTNVIPKKKDRALG
jgi:uncharacterized membrane protein (DUF2068 family)